MGHSPSDICIEPECWIADINLGRSENPHLLKSAALVNRSRRGRVIEALTKRMRALELEEEATLLDSALEETLTLTEIVPVTQSKPEVFLPKV